MAGAGGRFVLEALFLAGLAVAAGLAGLTTPQIIGVMALGWFVTVLIELVSWRLAVRHPAVVAVPQPLVEPQPEVIEAPPEMEPEVASKPKRRTRGLFRRAPREELTEPMEEVPEPPRHVRLIERGDDEDTATHDAAHQRAEGE